MASVYALQIAANHPAFAGHFPQRPVLPGVVLLDAALQQLALLAATPDEQWRIATAKFHQPVGPGTALFLQHDMLPDGSLRFTISAAATAAGTTRIVATGLLRPQAARRMATP